MRTSIWMVVPFVFLGLTPRFARAQPPMPTSVEQEISALASSKSAAHGNSDLDRALTAKNYERAERLLADAIARQPASRELLMQIASVFMMDRKPLNAAIAIKKAEALAPLENDARLQLALAYIALKRGDWARPELERLALAEPGNVIHRYWLARLDYDAGSYPSAVERLRVIVSEAPAFARAHDNLGLCYEALNELDEAVRHYREAVRLNRLDRHAPSGWPALNLGILLRSRGELDEAERLFREALKYDPRFGRAYYQLGAVLEQRGRMNEAVKALRRATSAEPASTEPYYALARIYRRQGQIAEAEAALATFKRLRDAQQAAGQQPTQ